MQPSKLPEHTRSQALFAVTLLQPNFLVSQSVAERIVQLSLFDFNLKLGTATAAAAAVVDGSIEFDDTLFETNAGTPNANGVPSPFLHCRHHTTAKGELSIRLECKRRARVHITAATLDKLLAIVKVAVEFCGGRNKLARSAARPIGTSNKLKIIQNAMLGAQKLNVSIDNIDFEFSSNDGVADVAGEIPFNVVVGIDQVSCNVDILPHPQRVQFKLNLGSFRLNTGHQIVVSPLSAEVKGSLTKENWKRDLLVSCNVRVNFVDIYVSPFSILNIQRAKSTLVDWTERFMAPADDLFGSGSIVSGDSQQCWWRDGKVLDSVMYKIPMPQNISPATSLCAETIDEHYQDDLR